MVKDNDNYGLSSMTKEKIVNLCKKHKLYVTPRLNDVLYLHYQGFTEIKELEEYVGLKCIYLECNAISKISGLEKQSELRCLLLHNNVIKKIENLDNCIHLDSINLSHNFITIIENMGSDILPKLNTLTITNNCLRTEESIANLIHLKALSVLDLSHNRIEDIVIVKILSQMPELKVLVLTGNPVVNQIPSYRKTLIINCKKLTYLDTRPVFDVDRACAEAWKRGGYEEERKERERWNLKERQKLISSCNNTLSMRQSEYKKLENDSVLTNGTIADISNNVLQVPSKICEIVENYNSEDSSNTQELSEKEDGEPDFEALENVSCDEENQMTDINCHSSSSDCISSPYECSFSDSVEQANRNDLTSTYMEIKSQQELIEELFACSNNSENVMVNANDSNLKLIEEISEINQKKEVIDKIIADSVAHLPDNENDNINVHIDLLKISDQQKANSNELAKNKCLENCKETEENIKNNLSKITFYCENVDKLLSDSLGGEENDEPIQEMTKILDKSI